MTDIDAAQNMVVIKTLPGLGQAAAMAIDAMRALDMVGTLGGDDTVFSSSCAIPKRRAIFQTGA